MGEKLGECSGDPLHRARHRDARQQGGGAARAWLPRTATRRPFDAIPRTAGGRRSGHGGKPIWAVSGANWTLGLK